MWIATGEAEVREDDHFGPVLNRAARVMSAGPGGQVLVEESTATLVGEVGLRSLGSRRLCDLSAPVGQLGHLDAGAVRHALMAIDSARNTPDTTPSSTSHRR